MHLQFFEKAGPSNSINFNVKNIYIKDIRRDYFCFNTKDNIFSYWNTFLAHVIIFFHLGQITKDITSFSIITQPVWSVNSYFFNQARYKNRLCSCTSFKDHQECRLRYDQNQPTNLLCWNFLYLPLPNQFAIRDI